MRKMTKKESKYTALRPVGRWRLRMTSARILGLLFVILRGVDHSCQSFTRKLSISMQSKTTTRGGNETSGSETSVFRSQYSRRGEKAKHYYSCFSPSPTRTRGRDCLEKAVAMLPPCDVGVEFSMCRNKANSKLENS